MEPVRHWRGALVLGPGEHDEKFCIATAQACRAQQHVTFVLDHKSKSSELLWQVANNDTATGWILDFTGQRTTYPVQYWDVGDPSYLVVVDRMNWMQPVAYDHERTQTQIDNQPIGKPAGRE